MLAISYTLIRWRFHRFTIVGQHHIAMIGSSCQNRGIGRASEADILHAIDNGGRAPPEHAANDLGPEVLIGKKRRH
jgi:hypothetical protein